MTKLGFGLPWGQYGVHVGVAWAILGRSDMTNISWRVRTAPFLLRIWVGLEG